MTLLPFMFFAVSQNPDCSNSRTHASTEIYVSKRGWYERCTATCNFVCFAAHGLARVHLATTTTLGLQCLCCIGVASEGVNGLCWPRRSSCGAIWAMPRYLECAPQKCHHVPMRADMKYGMGLCAFRM